MFRGEHLVFFLRFVVIITSLLPLRLFNFLFGYHKKKKNFFLNAIPPAVSHKVVWKALTFLHSIMISTSSFLPVLTLIFFLSAKKMNTDEGQTSNTLRIHSLT